MVSRHLVLPVPSHQCLSPLPTIAPPGTVPPAHAPLPLRRTARRRRPPCRSPPAEQTTGYPALVMHVWVGWADPAPSRPPCRHPHLLESWISARNRSLDPRLDVPAANQTPRLSATSTCGRSAVSRLPGEATPCGCCGQGISGASPPEPVAPPRSSPTHAAREPDIRRSAVGSGSEEAVDGGGVVGEDLSGVGA